MGPGEGVIIGAGGGAYEWGRREGLISGGLWYIRV